MLKLTFHSELAHPSPSDPNIHYTVEAWSNGSRVKDGHVPEDESKQTVG